MPNVQEIPPQAQMQMVALTPEQTGDNTASQTEEQKQPRLGLRGGGIIMDLCACFICCEACKGCCEAIDDCCCC